MGERSPLLVPPSARPFASGLEHLLAELDRLRLLLHREVLRLRATGLLTDDRFRGLYISDEQVDALLRQGHARQSASRISDDWPPELSELSRRAETLREQIAARDASNGFDGSSLPLSRLAEIFSLSDIQRDALLICLAVEIDLGFETLFSYAHNDVNRKLATPDLILRLLGNSQEQRAELRGIFSPAGPLLSAPLVRFIESAPEREGSFLSRPIKVERRIVDFVLGHSEVDERLRPFVATQNSNRPLSDLQIPESLRLQLKNASLAFSRVGGLLHFHGPKGSGKCASAAALAAEMGRPLLVADLARARDSGLPVPAVLSLLAREALLQGANLHLSHFDALLSQDSGNPQPLAAPASFSSAGLIISVGTESAPPAAGFLHGWRNFSLEFPLPNFAARVQLWDQAILANNCRQNGDLDIPVLAGKFLLTGGEIQSACRQAKDQTLLRGITGSAVSMADLEAAARAQSNHGLRRLAQKVNPACQWNDLVLPPGQIQQLREICATAKHRNLVYSTWGFDRRVALGKGLNILFHGQSGTGKTTGASIVAQELGLDLYKIDLSTVVSKYIGETEKQLSQIFREAKSSNAILFFDEADAIFGKRSEIKDAHDRYANTEVAYLLQKMEDEAIVILATNFRKNMDDAFTRRLHFIIEFPFPDAQYRERIWRSLIPHDAPLSDDVNFGFLARQFDIAGGNIRNVVVAAAFLAAENGRVIGMQHFICAMSRELQKLGRLRSPAEFGPYYELTRLKE